MSVNYAIKRRKLEGAPRCSHCGALLSLPKRFFLFLDKAARPGPARPCVRSSLSTVRLFCSNSRCDRGQQVTLLSVDVDGLERIYPVADAGEAERVMDRLFPQYKRAEPWVEERRILGGGGLTEADLIGSHRFSHTQKQPPLRGAQRRHIEEGSTEAASRGGADPRAGASRRDVAASDLDGSSPAKSNQFVGGFPARAHRSGSCGGDEEEQICLAGV